MSGGTGVKRFIEGQDRGQLILLPECLDDYVGEDNPVRVVEAFIEELDLAALGFAGVVPEATGRPSYHPATLLKIYLYGYLNRIASSRRLEREAQRNTELMWLTGRLMPDFKTIADFRRDNGTAIQATCRQFVLLCRKLDLFSDAVVGIDGSKFKAVNNRDKNYTPYKLQRRLEQIEASIARYLSAMEEVVRAAPDGQVSLTDPDARSMATSGKGTGIVGYNVQAAVDAQHHLIIAHEVTNVGNDRAQLSKMAQQARDASGQDALTVIADRGYFKGEEILACEQAGATPLVPKPLTSGAKAEGRFGKQDFVYIPEDDVYRCPAGELLTWRFDRVEDGQLLRHYWTTACQGCAIKAQCTTGKQRRIKRWEHESVIDAMQQRLDQAPDAMRIRRQTVEHPFGTIKAWMGATHFLTRGLKRVSTEMSLHVLAYNLKRMISSLGVRPLLEVIRA